MRNIITIVAIVLIAGSCSPKWAPDHYWSGKRWVLMEMKGVPVQLSGGGRDASLEFSWADKRFTGNGGCNKLNGIYELKGKKDIQFKDISSTKMACPDLAFENTFLETLRDVDGWEQEENRLLLKDNKKTVLVLQSRETTNSR
jgi:heat shock protein HslJ